MCGKMTAEQPQFKYWFVEFSELPRAMVITWVFSFDHINDARWLSMHIRDKDSLSEMNPAIYEELVAGKLIANNTNCPLSAVTLNQAQANANVKR
ncbi:hypothetical protein MAR_027648 [Mya arenaria]|uniref:Uncharacterized protein n=1 Tax=Mya arenaria TaxID=6604 RepID=A0ABY7EU46_MYAAR|nr:hypothetical protein MAR_027648 [Mya arenaria]